MTNKIVNAFMTALFVGAVAAPVHAGQPASRTSVQQAQSKAIHAGVIRKAPQRLH